MKKYDVHLMTPFCSWENIEAEDERGAIAQCSSEVWPDQYEPVSYLVIEVVTVGDDERCPHCGENRMDWLIWNDAGEIECQSCESVYSID